MSPHTLRIILLTLLLGAIQTQLMAAGPSTAVSTTVGGKTIWLRFDNLDDQPELLVDFVWVPTDPPGVTLLRGDNGAGTIFQWRIWCTDDQLRVNEVDIGTISAAGNYNYEVKIQNPTDNGPGARNLAGCNLTPASGQYANLLAGSHIAGDMLGNLTVQHAGPTGGQAALVIGGKVSVNSTLTVATLNALDVAGNFEGTLYAAPGSPPAGTRLNTNQFRIRGNLAPTASITLGEITPWMISEPFVQIDGDIERSGDLRGHLMFRNGIPNTASGLGFVVDILGHNHGTIDLGWTPQQPAHVGIASYGGLRIRMGGSGNVNNVGILQGSLWLSQNGSFSGIATILRVEGPGAATLEVWGPISGTLNIIEDMNVSLYHVGNFAGQGDITATGKILVGGNVGGTIGSSQIGASFDGLIEVGGNVSGAIFVNSNGVHHGKIHIKGSLIDGPLPEDISLGGTWITPANILFDYNGYQDDDDWIGAPSGAVIAVNGAQYRENSPSVRVYEVTCCRGDMNSDAAVNFDDIAGFTAALVSQAAYGADYPGLDGSWLFHGDVNGDAAVDFNDIDSFTRRLVGGCCSELACSGAACDTCIGDCTGVSTGGVAALFGWLSADEAWSARGVAELYRAHVPPARRTFFAEQLARLVGALEDAGRAANCTCSLWNARATNT